MSEETGEVWDRKVGVDVGFTGSREGMSQDQMTRLRELLSPPLTTWPMFRGFHHGDCVGSDEQAHEMIMGLRVKFFRQHGWGPEVIVHPPAQVRFRAFCQGDRIRKPKPYLERDKDIVLESELLIATPKTNTPVLRSGTWWTIGCATGLKKPVVIILPNGEIQTRNWDLGLTFGERQKLDREAREGKLRIIQ